MNKKKLKKYSIDIDYKSCSKFNNSVCGDVFYSLKDDMTGKTVCVLADGLGSGIKANVLATITSSMIASFVNNDININKAAKIIMKTLPVCSDRKIAYSTFTVVELNYDGLVKVIEYDNPKALLFDNNYAVDIKKQNVFLKNQEGRNLQISFYEFKLQPDYRLILFSDGITLSGIGTSKYPFGYGEDNVKKFISNELSLDREISARFLTKKIIEKSLNNDAYTAKDDMTVAVLHFRKSRHLLITSGAPYKKENDEHMAKIFINFEGKKVICGGTTSMIIARELGKKIETNIEFEDFKIPPCASMDGADLVCEGNITLCALIQLLENNNSKSIYKKNAAIRLFNFIMESDCIFFLIGTSINQAHQDPDLPVELGIRRNIINQIARLLKKNFLKEVFIDYL